MARISGISVNESAQAEPGKQRDNDRAWLQRRTVRLPLRGHALPYSNWPTTEGYRFVHQWVPGRPAKGCWTSLKACDVEEHIG